MAITTIAIAIGSALAGAIAKKSLDKTADAVVSTAKARLEQKLKLGKYGVIERALEKARDDVLDQCETHEQRQSVRQVLDALLSSKSGPLLAEFSTRITQTYLLPSPDTPPSQNLARIYRKVSGPAAILNDKVLDEASLVHLLDAYFMAFRERLLREPDFTHLREYFQLTEARAQTTLQVAILEQLEAIAANTAHSVDDFGSLRQEYRDYLVNDLKYHTIRGFSPQVGGQVISLQLARIFLPLEAVEGRPALAEYAEQDLLRQAAGEAMAELDWQNRRQEMEKRYAQLSARQAAQRPLNLAELLKSSRAVLLGDPGTGKTTITRYVAYALAADDYTHTGHSVEGLTPILIRLANYGQALDQDNTLHLIEYVEQELTPRPDLGRYLRHAIETGRCLIILDGLDEVTDPGLRMQVTDRIQKLVAGFSNNRYLATSRIVGYDLSPLTREFIHATLKEMSTEDQARFVRLWYDAIRTEIKDSTPSEGAQDLIDALRAKPQIGRMAANPLLLTIMVLMHWRGTKLPGRRVQVYQIATDTLLEYWVRQRGIDLDAEDIKPILAPIAHYILSSNVGGVIAHHDLLPRFFRGIAIQRGCNNHEAKRLGRELLQNLNEQSGLFLERGRDVNHQPVYGFLHQTFGEYLAALRMAEEMQEGRFELGNYIHRSMWHESLLLMAGHLAIYSKPQANALIREILDFPASYEATLQRNVLLAADCLADDIQIKPVLRDEVLHKLADALQHKAPQVREAAMERYRRLAVTKHSEPAKAALKTAINEVADGQKLSDEIRLDLMTALLYLDDRQTAQPMLWSLEEKTNHRIINEVRRLRFEYWPKQAADYLLELQADKNYGFSIVVDADLAGSTLGPVNGALALKVLGQAGFQTLLITLGERLKDEDDQAKLRWLHALAQVKDAAESSASLISPDTPAQIRYLAAARLLDSQKHRAEAIAALQALVATDSKHAPAAARTLLAAEETAPVDRRLLQDTALMANDFNAPAAIQTLFQAGDDAFALAAALHLLATCQPDYGRDRQLDSVVSDLFESGHSQMGRAATRWLALTPGYRYRLHACELLIEAGHVEETIPLLKFLAYECHDEASQQACRRLLVFREGEQVVPLLAHVVERAAPEVSYQACLALALAGQASDQTTADPQMRSRLKVAISAERRQTYQSARDEFCRTGVALLDDDNATDNLTRSAQSLARLSLQRLVHPLTPFEQTGEVKQLLTCGWPAVQVSAARLAQSIGLVDAVQQCLATLVRKKDQNISEPVRWRTVQALGLIRDNDTISLLSQTLSDEDSNVRFAAAVALGQLGDAAAVQLLLIALSDEDWPVRNAAAQALGQSRDPAAFHPLLTALNDEDLNVRFVAAQALGQLREPTAIHPLLTALSDEDRIVRFAAAQGLVAAAQALGQLDDPTAVHPLLTALGDEDNSVRSAAVHALGRSGDAAAVQPLLTAFSDEDNDVRSTAARALGWLGDAAALQPLLTALSDEDSSVRSAAAEALGRLGDAAALQPLLTVLSDEDDNVRSAAARALGWLGDPAAAQSLLAALSDQDSSIRSAAAEALGRLGDAAALPSLLTALSDEDDDRVRSAAARALGWLGDAAALQPLLTALSDENSNVRSAAARALGQLGDPAALPPLLTALSDEDWSVRSAAARALGQLGDPAALPPLLTALSDEENNVRHAAADALGQLGDWAAVQPLIAVLSDENSRVRSAAAGALGWLGARDAARIIAATVIPDHSAQATALIHLDPAIALAFLESFKQHPRQGSRLFRLRGQARWQSGDLDAALTDFQQAVSMEHDNNSNNLLALAHFYLEQDKLQLAKEYVEKAVAERPKSTICLVSQAVVLWLGGETQEALEKLGEVYQENRHIAGRPYRDDLAYEHFWRDKALAVFEAMLAELTQR